MPIWTQFVEPQAIHGAGQVYTPGFMPSTAAITGLTTSSGGRLGAPPATPRARLAQRLAGLGFPNADLSGVSDANVANDLAYSDQELISLCSGGPDVRQSWCPAPAAPSCTPLPTNPNAGQPGVNDPYFASQDEHDAWAASHGGCPIPPWIAPTPQPPPQQQPPPGQQPPSGQPPVSTPLPTPVSPPDMASVPAGPVTFKWNTDVASGVSTVRVCSGPNGTGTCNSTSTNSGDLTASIPLTAGTYYWSVQSMDATGTAPGPWSTDRTITVTGASSQLPTGQPPGSTPGQTPPSASTEPSLGTIAVIVGLSAAVIWLLYQQVQQPEAGDSKPRNESKSSNTNASRSLTPRRSERTRP